MKIAINVKNLNSSHTISKNDLLLYDGQDYYVTTVDDIYSKLENKINTAIQDYCEREQNILKETISLNSEFNKLQEEFEQVKEEFKDFKSKVSSQIAEMATIIKELNK